MRSALNRTPSTVNVYSIMQAILDIIDVDSRSHLEVADPLHRYGKNLRLYYKEFEKLQSTEKNSTNRESGNLSMEDNGRVVNGVQFYRKFEPFFQWLKGADEESAPNLKECPRVVLDNDRVRYIDNQEEREQFRIDITPGGLFRRHATGEMVETGPKGWIFVLLHNRMYACEKRTSASSSLRFHHSSFFAGRGVHAAGMIVCVAGRLVRLLPHSGHYRPHDRHLCSLLRLLRSLGVPLRDIQVDAQRVMKQARHHDKDGSKTRKSDSALYENGETLYNFLRTKQKMLNLGLLEQLQCKITLRQGIDTVIHTDTETDREADVCMCSDSDMDTDSEESGGSNGVRTPDCCGGTTLRKNTSRRKSLKSLKPDVKYDRIASTEKAEPSQETACSVSSTSVDNDDANQLQLASARSNIQYGGEGTGTNTSSIVSSDLSVAGIEVLSVEEFSKVN